MQHHSSKIRKVADPAVPEPDALKLDKLLEKDAEGSEKAKDNSKGTGPEQKEDRVPMRVARSPCEIHLRLPEARFKRFQAARRQVPVRPARVPH